MIDRVLILTRSDLLDETYQGKMGFTMSGFKLLSYKKFSESNIIVFVDDDGSLHVLKNRYGNKGKSTLAEVIVKYNTSTKA